MKISQVEFKYMSENKNVDWVPLIESEIKEGKSYLISNKQINHKNRTINVVEVINDFYRVVSTRAVCKNSPYICFDVASDVKKTGQKNLKLHRARLISFKNIDSKNIIVRHGKNGRKCHDLNNLSRGTHQDNMDDAVVDASHKGQNNSSSKINDSLALVIYTLSQLNLVDSSVIKYLPLCKGSIDAIKAKRQWSHVVTEDIDLLIQLCIKVRVKKQDAIFSKKSNEIDKTHKRQLAQLKKEFRNNINYLLSSLT
ncbi:MAG: hypothetical protein ACI9EK_002059 [Psychroserpens sp.]|jgi:hypothetical protein